MKKIISNISKYIITFLILIVIFNVCLYIVCLFDSKKIENNVYRSYYTLSNQGMFYQLSTILKLFNNNCTDTVIINESYSVDHKNPFESYMRARKNYKVGTTLYELEEATGEGASINYIEATGKEEYSFAYDPVSELGNFLSGKIHYSLNYGRYWHGYLILYRPLLLLFDITQIRVILLLSFITLFGYFLYLINNRFGKRYTVIFGMSLLFSGYFSASYSLESSPIFLTMMISAIILIKRIDKIKNFSIYLFAVACITNYFDYLTVPLITLGMLCSLYLIKLIEEGKNWLYCLKFVILNAIIWLFGYAGTWLFKWILYDLTIGGEKSMLEIGFTQSFYRMKRINLTVSSSNVEYLSTILNIISKSSLYTLITFGAVLFVNKFKISTKEFNRKSLAFIALATIPIGWYLVLANHTVMHYYFTYRHSLIFMLGILLAINEILFGQNEQKKRIKQKEKI